MKKLFSLLAIIGIILASNCSRIPENNDPVIGIWSNVVSSNLSQSSKSVSKQEWIFNDAYLGRYHSYENKELAIKTDFKWIHENGKYTISYPGTDLPTQIVTLEKTEVGTLLEDENGNIIAVRE